MTRSRHARWTLTVAALLPLLLASCTINYYQYPALPDPANPLVLVTEGRVSVNQEPLYFTKPGKVTITWRLPAGDRYTFPKDAVTFEAVGEVDPEASVDRVFDCQKDMGPRPHEFTCSNNARKPGRYKYTLRVTDGSTPLKPLKPLDPMIVNDW